MLTVNVDFKKRVVNGQMGTVKHIQKDSTGAVVKIYVKFDDSQAGIERYFNGCFWSSKFSVPSERAEANIRIRTNKDTSPVIIRTQFSLMLAWGYIVYQMQGIVLEKVVISFDGHMLYVASSRVTSVNEFYITDKINTRSIRVDPRAVFEYQRKRNQKQLLISKPLISEKSSTCVLWNTRSFNKTEDGRLLM